MTPVRLAVELHGTRVGELHGGARDFDFHAAAEGMERFGVNSDALSVTMPLTPGQRRDTAGRRRNWFAELLPEGDQYEYMLAQARLRDGDVPAFLARYGRDVAGAVQLWDLDDPTEPRVPDIRRVSDDQVRALLEDPVGAPLGNDGTQGKTSLDGVQPKIVLVRAEGGWAQPLGGYPSTHILKPQLEGWRASFVYDEEYGLRLARRVGLLAYAAEVTDFGGKRALVIERFDRTGTERIHQESFSQVLGAAGNQKYQRYGGVVSLARVARSLMRYAPAAELGRLARMVVFAVAVGNLDMHTKNIGLLHPLDEDVALAPAYDVVPQAHHPNDGELALAVNRKYRHAEVMARDLEAEFSGWGLRHAADVVAETLDAVAGALAAEVPLPGAHPALQEEISTFVNNLRAGREVGA